MRRAMLLAAAALAATVASATACGGRRRPVAVVDGCAGEWRCVNDAEGPRDCVCNEKR